MANRSELEQILSTAKMILTVLETQAAGYTNLTIPAHLKVQLDEKRQEVESIKARLAQLQGGNKAADVPDNLPRYNNIFVGRENDISRCLEALSPEDRGWGVAIDAIGGMGKTALALEVATLARKQAIFDAYLFASAKTTWLSPDGVRQETLALSSLDAFCREFARILELSAIMQITDATERRRALLDALRGRRVLLIWDNLETLTPEERDQIAEFLRKLPAPNKAIVTSRYRTGESALTIRLDKLTLKEATELMLQVGQRQPRVAQELQQAGENGWQALYDAAAGNPLALDWTLGLIAQKGYSFNTALERLQNAAASIDLYGFLFNDAVQGLKKIDLTLLSVLSVFLTPTTIDALADISKLNPTEIRSGLDRLISLSLVNDLDGGRFGLHPLTRNYVIVALSKTPARIRIPFFSAQLDANDQRKALRYWVDYAQKYGGEGNDAYKTFDMLEAEWQTLEGIANTLRELSGIPRTLQDSQAAQMLIDLGSSLANATGMMFFRGYWDEVIILGEWCYEAGQALSKWSDAGWGAYHVAWIHFNRGETDRAATWTDKMATAMERGGSRRDRAIATRMQGQVARQRKDWKKAQQHYQEAVAAYRELEDKDAEGNVLNDLGELARQQQQYDLAETYYQQALAIAEKLGDKEGQADHCGGLGQLNIDRDRPKDARPWFERQLSLAQEVGRQDLVASAKSGLAQVLEAEKRYGEALAIAQQALQIRERLVDKDLGFSRSQVERLQRLVRS